jgi:RNA polymerase sigma-54 factor
MKASLQLRLSQHLALTPQLQQSIRLLQLSTLELQQEVAMAVAQNPLLENEDDWIASPLRVAADGSLITSANTSSAPPEPLMNNGSSSSTSTSERSESGEPQGVDEYNGTDGGSDSNSWNLEDYGRSNTGSDDDDLPPLQIHESTTTLRDHLTAQLRMTQANQRDRALITFLIESLDEDGYLTSSLEEVQADLPDELEVDVDELSAALALLQSFDPPGVGGRSASECLKLQLLRPRGRSHWKSSRITWNCSPHAISRACASNSKPATTPCATPMRSSNRWSHFRAPRTARAKRITSCRTSSCAKVRAAGRRN